MSASSEPISAARFATALPNLPLSSLHQKATEIRNSILHLEKSNKELRDYADLGDEECAKAVQENIEVITRMKERVELLKQEVVRRGQSWNEDDKNLDEAMSVGDLEPKIMQPEPESAPAPSSQTHGRWTETTGGRLGDEELSMLLMERMEEDSGDRGIHL